MRYVMSDVIGNFLRNDTYFCFGGVIKQLYHAFYGPKSYLSSLGLPDELSFTTRRPRAIVHRVVHSTLGDRFDYRP